MFVDIFKEVATFLEQLSKEQNLLIIIHDFDGFTINYRNDIPPIYPIGKRICKYCDYIMSTENTLKHCLEKQLNVLDHCKNNEPFFGMCYAGVEEFVVPIIYNNKPLGFISVNGYRSDEQKALSRIDYISKEYGFSKKQLVDNYYNSLKPNPPELKTIQNSIRVAARLLELAFKEILITESMNRQILNRETLFDQIKLYLELNYMSEINNKMLSDFFRCSASKITHTFKKNCGITIKGYLNLVRIEIAKEQLIHSLIPISNIVSNVGFTDSSYFAKVFKQTYGISPIEYRKKFQTIKSEHHDFLKPEGTKTQIV